jgi:aspartate ammonia-lyase
MRVASDVLARIPLLREVDRKLAERIAALFREERWPAGEVLHRQDTPRDRLLVVDEGAVDICRTEGPEQGAPLITYGPGDVLNEGVLVGIGNHSTTAIAKTPVKALVADGAALRLIMDSDPDLKATVYHRIIERLAERLDRLAPLASPDALQMTSGETRIERDLLGEKAVPADAYFGIQSARALDNFKITGVPVSLYPDFIAALAMVKWASAKANCDCGVISAEIRDGIVSASEELIQGKLHEQFSVDVIQGGAGTSTNMNANEVIANRALELMGHSRGEYAHCSPNDHVNASQSTNDVYPSALKLAMLASNRRLVDELKRLVAAFRTKGKQFADVLKMGRTHLQDAVPMTLGQEFEAFARTLEGEIDGLEAGARTLLEINMGGTAVGTGLNAPPGYSEKCVAYMREVSGFPFVLAPDLVEATQDTQGFVLYSSTLRSLAVKLIKVCNDLRLLASGPRAGLAEIRLPERQPGSSIMPGKVNPVIPEVVNQVGFKVIGNDLSVTLAAQAGQLQLNVMEPVIAACILDSVRMTINACVTLRRNCVEGVEAAAERCADYVDHSIGVVTALVPVLGYKMSSALAREALETGKGPVELVREKKLLTEEQIAEILSPARMANPLGR